MVSLTTQTVSDEIRRQMKLSTKLVDIQTSISTEIKVNKASDDPQAWIQISEIGRTQSQNASWASNISYAQTRAATADANMDEIGTMLTRAQELMTSAGTITNSTGRAAIATELAEIQKSINDLLSQKDALGVSVFDQGQSLMIPVGKNLTVSAVPTVASLNQNINVGGTNFSLDQIFSDAIAGLNADSETARAASLAAFQSAGDTLNLARTTQGHRANKLDTLADNMIDTKLNLQEQRDSLEKTNLSEAIAMLQSTALSLDAAQAAYAKISQQSLFDLIR